MSKSLRLALRKVIAAVDNLNNRNSRGVAVNDLDEVNTLLDNALSELQWGELTKQPKFPSEPGLHRRKSDRDEEVIEVLRMAYLSLVPGVSEENKTRARNKVSELMAKRNWF